LVHSKIESVFKSLQLLETGFDIGVLPCPGCATKGNCGAISKAKKEGKKERCGSGKCGDKVQFTPDQTKQFLGIVVPLEETLSRYLSEDQNYGVGSSGLQSVVEEVLIQLQEIDLSQPNQNGDGLITLSCLIMPFAFGQINNSEFFESEETIWNPYANKEGVLRLYRLRAENDRKLALFVDGQMANGEVVGEDSSLWFTIKKQEILIASISAGETKGQKWGRVLLEYVVRIALQEQKAMTLKTTNPAMWHVARKVFEENNYQVLLSTHSAKAGFQPASRVNVPGRMRYATISVLTDELMENDYRVCFVQTDKNKGQIDWDETAKRFGLLPEWMYVWVENNSLYVRLDENKVNATQNDVEIAYDRFIYIKAKPNQLTKLHSIIFPIFPFAKFASRLGTSFNPNIRLSPTICSRDNLKINPKDVPNDFLGCFGNVMPRHVPYIEAVIDGGFIERALTEHQPTRMIEDIPTEMYYLTKAPERGPPIFIWRRLENGVLKTYFSSKEFFESFLQYFSDEQQLAFDFKFMHEYAEVVFKMSHEQAYHQ